MTLSPKLYAAITKEGQGAHCEAAHCDPTVVHAPGECEYCDLYPYRQALMDLWRVNFTGHSDPDRLPSLAEQRRPLDRIEHWPGNVPPERELG